MKVKNKKKVIIFSIYVIALALLPFKLYRGIIGADISYIDVKTQMNTVSSEYPILKTESYNDMGLLFTSKRIIKVTPDATRWIVLPSEMSTPEIIKKDSNSIYVVDSSNKLFNISLKDEKVTESKVDFGEDSYLIQSVLDKDGYAWFLYNTRGKDKLNLMRTDLRNLSDKRIIEVPKETNIISTIGSDSRGNIWFLSKTGAGYSFTRANYDSFTNNIVVNSLDLPKVDFSDNINFVIDWEGNIWHFSQTSKLIRKLIVNGNNVSIAQEIKFPDQGELEVDSDGDLWVRVRKESQKIIEFQKLKYGEFETIYTLPYSYENFSIGDDDNLLQTYRLFIATWANPPYKYSYIAINDSNEKIFKQLTNDRIATLVQQTKDMIKAARNSHALYDFDNAYKTALELPVKEQNSLIAELETFRSDVETPDVLKVRSILKSYGNNKNLKNYYDLTKIIDTEVKLDKNKQYLLGELDKWENREIFTLEVIEATNAIAKAWDKKDDETIKAAEDAVKKVQSKDNNKWLMDQIDEIKVTVKKNKTQ